MHLHMLRAKILRAEVTDARKDYEGSLAIDAAFLDMVGLLPYEKILVGNITDGQRFETYVIPAPAGSRTFSLNGAAAHRGKIGDLIVIMAFATMTPEEARHCVPRVLVLGQHNKQIVDLREGTRQEPTLPPA